MCKRLGPVRVSCSKYSLLLLLGITVQTVFVCLAGWFLPLLSKFMNTLPSTLNVRFNVTEPETGGCSTRLVRRRSAEIEKIHQRCNIIYGDHVVFPHSGKLNAHAVLVCVVTIESRNLPLKTDTDYQFACHRLLTLAEMNKANKNG